MADLIDTVVGRMAITFRTMGLWSSDAEPAVNVQKADLVPGRYYLRFRVNDRPGVLAEIAGILGSHQISIASVIQHEVSEDGDQFVPLIIMTHAAADGDLSKAMQAIDRLPCVQAGSVQMRVRD
ncbi:MAG: ACT domain-containing protein [Patescibacteria group bacterium]|nr:ACT domain-containing protein [Patescibacteria group bacterium]